MISLPKRSNFNINPAIKTVTLLSAYDKNWTAVGAAKKIIIYYYTNWLTEFDIIIAPCQDLLNMAVLKEHPEKTNTEQYKLKVLKYVTMNA